LLDVYNDTLRVKYSLVSNFTSLHLWLACKIVKVHFCFSSASQTHYDSS
jgi:hypothetical protein